MNSGPMLEPSLNRRLNCQLVIQAGGGRAFRHLAVSGRSPRPALEVSFMSDAALPQHAHSLAAASSLTTGAKHCPACAAAIRAVTDYLAGADLGRAVAQSGSYCARHAAILLDSPAGMNAAPAILGELARGNEAWLEGAEANHGGRGAALPDAGSCPLCMQEQGAARHCTLAMIKALNDGHSHPRESVALELCFPHLLSMLAEDRLDRVQCAAITGGHHARLSALMGSATYEQKLTTHNRFPDRTIADAVLHELAGDQIQATTLRLSATSPTIPPGCPVCLRLCDAWSSRLAMLDADSGWQQDLYDLMPTAPENVWAMCDQSHNTALRGSIATAGAYRMLGELEFLMLHNQRAGQRVALSGIRSCFHALLERRCARRTFLASCRHPFTCPVDRYIHSVARYQLSRLLASMRSSEGAHAYRETPGLCMVHLRDALSLGSNIEIVQLLLRTARVRNQQLLAQIHSTPTVSPVPLCSTPGPAASVGYESASRFFSGVDYRHGTTQ